MDTKNWMRDMTAIDARPLKDIVLPGSHDAGAFVMYSSADNKSSRCQGVEVIEQLRAGSRYLDLRAWRSKDTYWMFHGAAWTSVKLEDVLQQIVTFLNESPKEIVLATLLINDSHGRWDEAGWRWACKQVEAHLALREVVPNGSFAHATPNTLRTQKQRLVLLRHEAAPNKEAAADIDRDGVYAGTIAPMDALNKLGRYRVPNDKMWILHTGLPFTGAEIAAAIFSGSLSYLAGESLEDKARRAADFFRVWFDGALRKRRLNVINVDFVHEFGWVEAIVALNREYPKTLPVYFGSEQGDPFKDPPSSPEFFSVITKIEVRHAAWVDALRLSYFFRRLPAALVGSISVVTGPWHGGPGGTAEAYVVPSGHNIVRVEGAAGDYIDRLQFFTDKGSQSKVFGGPGGTPFTMRVDDEAPGGGLASISGRASRGGVHGVTFEVDFGG